MLSAIDRYKRETARYAQRAFRFRRRKSAVEFAETVRRMAGGARFRFDFAPYQREMMETPYHPDVQMTAYMLPSRTGKTETVMNIIGHGICEDPKGIIVMYPTNSQAEKWAKETLMTSLINSTPELSELIGDDAGRRKSGNTILHKLFPGGVLNAFGANSPGEMRRSKGNLIFADEIDAIEYSEADEGDALEVLWVRGSEYPDTIKIAASYPSVKGRSRIESIMLQSDWRVMYYPCEKCGEPFVMHRSQLRYKHDRPEDAWLECPVNQCQITDSDRKKMILSNDKWTPTRPFNGIAGFHASGMISPHPTQKGFKSHLHYVAVQELAIEKAENREKALRVFVNTFDAETYQAPAEEKPDPIGLESEAYEYLYRVGENQLAIPAGILLVTFGFDVQGDRIEGEFVGWGMNGQTWGLGYHVLQGNTLEPQVWQKLDSLLSLSEFVHPCGKNLRAVSVFGDAKYRRDKVTAFTVPRQSRGVFAVYGSTVLGKPIVGEPKKHGREISYEIGTHEAKGLIYQNADLRRDRDSSEFPHNYMHFPTGGWGYTDEYFRRLLIEDVELKKANDGSFQQFFSNPNRLRNEPLDVRVYNIAAERKLKPAYGIISKKMVKKEGELPENAEELPQKSRNYILDT